MKEKLEKFQIEIDAAIKAGNVDEAERLTQEAERLLTLVELEKKNEELRKRSLDFAEVEEDVANSIEARTGDKPREFSLRNLVLASGNDNPGARREAEHEMTLIEESGLVSREGGIPIPMKYLFTEKVGRSQPSQEERVITASGSNAVSTDIGIDNYAAWLADAAPIMDYVTIVPGLTGNYNVPVISTKAPNSGAAAEGASPTTGDPTTGNVSLTPKTIQGMVTFTNQSLAQTAGFVERALRENLVATVADDLHQQILSGSGSSNQATGVRNTTGTNTGETYTSANQGRWDELAAARWKVDANNLPRNRRAYFLHVNVLQAAENTSRDTGSGRFVYENGMIGQDFAFSSGHLTANDGVYGEWSECFVGLWDGPAAGSELIVDRVTSKGNTLIALITFADVGVRRLGAFTNIDQS